MNLCLQFIFIIYDLICAFWYVCVCVCVC